MLTKEQRDSIMKLYGEGLNISEIARKVGVSRHSVYRVIQGDIEQDPEIHALKKKLRKARLQRSIMETKKPMLAESRLDKLEGAVGSLISDVLLLLDLCPGTKSDEPETHYCYYCGKELEYIEKKDSSGLGYSGYECTYCKRIFLPPTFPEISVKNI